MNLEQLKAEIRVALETINIDGNLPAEAQQSAARNAQREIADRLATAINAYVQSEITRRFSQLPANLICSAPGSPVTPGPTYINSVVL